uniref:Uncharacterized protein n=1 Tax=Vai augu virus TaxID=2800949 RepID=A0A894KCM5_9VIRU|nr:MAG: hypothetical protein [Vai augu virus]
MCYVRLSACKFWVYRDCINLDKSRFNKLKPRVHIKGDWRMAIGKALANALKPLLKRVVGRVKDLDPFESGAFGPESKVTVEFFGRTVSAKLGTFVDYCFVNLKTGGRRDLFPFRSLPGSDHMLSAFRERRYDMVMHRKITIIKGARWSAKLGCNVVNHVTTKLVPGGIGTKATHEVQSLVGRLRDPKSGEETLDAAGLFDAITKSFGLLRRYEGEPFNVKASNDHYGLVVRSLLILAGVERNPGPTPVIFSKLLDLLKRALYSSKEVLIKFLRLLEGCFTRMIASSRESIVVVVGLLRKFVADRAGAAKKAITEALPPTPVVQLPVAVPIAATAIEIVRKHYDKVKTSRVVVSSMEAGRAVLGWLSRVTRNGEYMWALAAAGVSDELLPILVLYLAFVPTAACGHLVAIVAITRLIYARKLKWWSKAALSLLLLRSGLELNPGPVLRAKEARRLRTLLVPDWASDGTFHPNNPVDQILLELKRVGLEAGQAPTVFEMIVRSDGLDWRDGPQAVLERFSLKEFSSFAPKEVVDMNGLRAFTSARPSGTCSEVSSVTGDVPAIRNCADAMVQTESLSDKEEIVEDVYIPPTRLPAVRTIWFSTKSQEHWVCPPKVVSGWVSLLAALPLVRINPIWSLGVLGFLTFLRRGGFEREPGFAVYDEESQPLNRNERFSSHWLGCSSNRIFGLASAKDSVGDVRYFKGCSCGLVTHTEGGSSFSFDDKTFRKCINNALLQPSGAQLSSALSAYHRENRLTTPQIQHGVRDFVRCVSVASLQLSVLEGKTIGTSGLSVGTAAAITALSSGNQPANLRASCNQGLSGGSMNCSGAFSLMLTSYGQSCRRLIGTTLITCVTLAKIGLVGLCLFVTRLNVIASIGGRSSAYSSLAIPQASVLRSGFDPQVIPGLGND